MNIFLFCSATSLNILYSVAVTGFSMLSPLVLGWVTVCGYT